MSKPCYLALPPTSVALSASPPAMRVDFRAEHLRPIGLLVVPVLQQDLNWYHVGPDNRPQSHDEIKPGHVPESAQLLDLPKRTDITYGNGSFELEGPGFSLITDHIRERKNLPADARWLLVLLHPQITTDIKHRGALEALPPPLSTPSTWDCPVYESLAIMLKLQNKPAMAGRVVNGLLLS